MSTPKVSIVVPVYNAERYLERCINSLKAQTLCDIEIILVDDCSTDRSLEICENMAKDDKRIKIIHKENEGAGFARNSGLESVSGEYVGFCDSDDYVEPCMFEVLYNKAREHNSELVISGVTFVGGSVFGKENGISSKDYFDKDTNFDTADSLNELKMGIVGSLPKDEDDSKYGMGVWKNLFKTEVIKKNNITFVSERTMISEDAVFLIDYISCINKATGIKGAFYNYCRNEDSVSKGRKADRFEKSLVFAERVKKSFGDIGEAKYSVYLNRFWQAMCRVIITQEIMYAKEKGISFSETKKTLKKVCTHSFTVKALREYPLATLPVKQRVFAYAMKYRMYTLLKILVEIRSK